MNKFSIFFFLLVLPFTKIIGQTINAGPDTTICLGGTATLHAEVTGTGFGTDSYTFETYAYSPESYTGGTQVNFAGNQDDQIAGPFDIGFSFCFFNQNYSQFYIGTNGWVGFSYNAAWITYTSAPIPSTDPAVPKNCIMAPWEDWWPNYWPAEKNVYYYITGTAPNRKLVVYWWHCPMYGCYTTYGTFQIVLNEQSSIVENHLTNKPYCSSSGGTATQGVHNSDGTVAFTATGRNSTVWTTTNESTRFVPSGIKWYVGGFPGGTIVGYGPDLIQSPTATTTYTAVVETCGSMAATDDVTVTVIDPAFSYPQSTYCANDPDPVPNVLQIGGTFTATPAGLVFISTATGEIDLSASIPGIYSVTYTIVASCTISQSHPITIVTPPNPPLAAPDSVSRCDTGNVTLNVIQIPGTNINWYDAPTGGNKYPFSGTPVIVSITATTIFYAEAVTNVNNCISPSRTPIVAIVRPIPIITNTTINFQQCSEVTTNITLESSVNPTTFTWTATSASPDITGYSNGSGNIIQQTLHNTGFLPGIVTYSVTPHAAGCDGIAVEFIVTVNPIPDVYLTPATLTICSGTQINVAIGSHVAASTFFWTASGSSVNVSGFADGSGNTILQNLFNAGNTVETVTYVVSPTANGCAGIPVSYVVTVNPVPVLSNAPLAKQQCNNQPTNLILTSNVSGTLFTWTATGSSLLVSGYSDNSIPTVTLNQTLINSGNNIETVTYHITPHANNCDGVITDFVVTVYPIPDLLNTPATKYQCNNLPTNITLTSNVTGTLFTWTASGSSLLVTGYSDNTTPTISLNQTLVNSGFMIETVTYHLTPHANGCDGNVTDYVVTVYPTADAYFQPAAQTICTGQTTNVDILSHVTGTTFTWTASASSPLVNGFLGGSGTNISQTIFSSSTLIETVTYVITPLANGCTGTTSSLVVTVNPGPILSTSPPPQTICSAQSINVSLTSNVAGTTFSWTASATSPNISGFSGGSGNMISQTLINSGYTIETVTYHITATANGCASPVTNYIVTVNPKPDVSNDPLSSQICSGTSPNINLTSNVSGTNFSWTATGSSPNVTGYGPGSGTVINQILINLGLSTESVTYHITPFANGCNGDVTDYVVTIVSIPDVYFQPPAQTICSEQSCNIQNLSHVVGTTFTWTASGSSFLVTGYSGGSGNLIQQTLVNSGTTIETITYTVSPAAFGCPPGIAQNVVVTVNPKPAITNNNTTSQICSGATTNIIPQSNVPGSNYTWTVTGSSLLVSGFSAGSGLQIQQTLINTGYNIETVTYNVTPIANSCLGNPVAFTVTVFPVADVYFTPPSQAICPLQTSNITINSHVAGSSFTWTATGSSLLVSGYSGGSGNLIKQTLNNTGYNIETVTYHVSPTANGCAGTNNNVIVTVNPNPTVTFTPCWDNITTTNAKPVTLKGGIPLNGTYSGPGVSAGIFFPAVAGVGTFSITYSYSNLYSCSGTASQSITVIAPLFFTCGNNLTDIRDSKSYPTVLIGTQCWMAANLDYGIQMPGTQNQRDNCIIEKYCYNDNPGNCTSSGGLYQWDELMKYDNTEASQGYCPPGWHIPTENEWNTLFNFYISNGFAGSPLKYTGFSGFNASLYGVWFKNVSWNFNNFATLFWSSTSHGPFKAWAHGMNEQNPSVSFYPSARNNAFPVRCIKD